MAILMGFARTLTTTPAHERTRAAIIAARLRHGTNAEPPEEIGKARHEQQPQHPSRKALGRQVDAKREHGEEDDRPEAALEAMARIARRERAADDVEHDRHAPGELDVAVGDRAARHAGWQREPDRVCEPRRLAPRAVKLKPVRSHILVLRRPDLLRHRPDEEGYE